MDEHMAEIGNGALETFFSSWDEQEAGSVAAIPPEECRVDLSRQIVIEQDEQEAADNTGSNGDGQSTPTPQSS